jgi:hypothetical protein
MLNRSKVKEELDGGAMGELIGTKNGKLALMRGSQSPPSSPILSATVTGTVHKASSRLDLD